LWKDTKKSQSTIDHVKKDEVIIKGGETLDDSKKPSNLKYSPSNPSAFSAIPSTKKIVEFSVPNSPVKIHAKPVPEKPEDQIRQSALRREQTLQIINQKSVFFNEKKPKRTSRKVSKETDLTASSNELTNSSPKVDKPADKTTTTKKSDVEVKKEGQSLKSVLQKKNEEEDKDRLQYEKNQEKLIQVQLEEVRALQRKTNETKMAQEKQNKKDYEKVHAKLEKLKDVLQENVKSKREAFEKGRKSLMEALEKKKLEEKKMLVKKHEKDKSDLDKEKKDMEKDFKKWIEKYKEKGKRIKQNSDWWNQRKFKESQQIKIRNWNNNKKGKSRFFEQIWNLRIRISSQIAFGTN